MLSYTIDLARLARRSPCLSRCVLALCHALKQFGGDAWNRRQLYKQQHPGRRGDGVHDGLSGTDVRTVPAHRTAGLWGLQLYILRGENLTAQNKLVEAKAEFKDALERADAWPELQPYIQEWIEGLTF